MKSEKITLHWTAGLYLPNAREKNDYHLLILKDGEMLKTHNFYLRLEHCWQDNTGNLGLAVCGMLGARPGDFGAYPFTPRQLSGLVEAAAMLCVLKNIPVEAVQTHAERAVGKGYFGERWDFAVLAPLAKITPGEAWKTGNFLRGKITEKLSAIKAAGLYRNRFYPVLINNFKEEQA